MQCSLTYCGILYISSEWHWSNFIADTALHSKVLLVCLPPVALRLYWDGHYWRTHVSKQFHIDALPSHRVCNGTIGKTSLHSHVLGVYTKMLERTRIGVHDFP